LIEEQEESEEKDISRGAHELEMVLLQGMFAEDPPLTREVSGGDPLLETGLPLLVLLL